MKHTRSLMFVMTAIVCMSAVSAFAADDLFDTATATKHLDQGIAHLKAKNLDAAVSEFEAAAEAAPEAEAYYYLGYTYYLKGKNNDAESRQLSLENFEKAYEIDPSFSPTRLKPVPAENPQPDSQKQ